MYIALLGRQPALSVAELEVLYGSSNVQWFSNIAATISTDDFDFNRLGGTQKAGRVVAELRGNWRQVGSQIAKNYEVEWAKREGKITLGISAYGFRESARDIQKTGLILKKKLREHGVSMRLIPNTEAALNTAASHHNKLGLNDSHVELLIVRAGDGRVIVAESIGAQNITAFAARDQARPKTDAFVGMLPPKLARMMVNMSGATKGRVLDPFCGTGVVLQEAALMSANVYGTDLSERMVDYTRDNLQWLKDMYQITFEEYFEVADATKATWQQPIDAVVTEVYLGQPMTTLLDTPKLEKIMDECDSITRDFLVNLRRQLAPGTRCCIAVPAWFDRRKFLHLKVVDDLEKIGYNRISFERTANEDLIYHRENQVVARELLVITVKE